MTSSRTSMPASTITSKWKPGCYTFRNLISYISISNESEAAYMDRLIDPKFEQIRDHISMMASLKRAGSVSAHFLMTACLSTLNSIGSKSV